MKKLCAGTSLGVLLLPLLLFARTAAADNESCSEAATQGQLLRDNGKFSAARAQFAVCLESTCPAVIRRDCDHWLSDLDARTPTVMFRVQDRSGGDLLSATIVVDGETVQGALEGRGIRLDPGKHVVTASAAGMEPVRREVLVREAEKDRALEFVLATPSAPVCPPPGPSTNAKEHVPTAAIVLFGVSAAALVTSVGFADAGIHDWTHLQSGCRGHCTDADVASARREFAVADIAAVITAASFGVAMYLFARPRLGTPATAYASPTTFTF